MNAVYSPVAYGNPRDNEVSNAQMNSTTRHLLKQNWPYISPSRIAVAPVQFLQASARIRIQGQMARQNRLILQPDQRLRKISRLAQ